VVIGRQRVVLICLKAHADEVSVNSVKLIVGHFLENRLQDLSILILRLVYSLSWGVGTEPGAGQDLFEAVAKIRIWDQDVLDKCLGLL
jgi:hypothetical protein